MRLRHALDGVEVIRRRFAEADRRPGPELDAALDAVRSLDESQAAAIGAAYERFYEQHPPHERPVIARHREEVAAIVAECGAIAIAGGHVGVLNDCLHLFNLGDPHRGPAAARLVVRLHGRHGADRRRRR